jgi:hypothetical protein
MKNVNDLQLKTLRWVVGCWGRGREVRSYIHKHIAARSRRNLGGLPLTLLTWAAQLDYSPISQLLNEHSEHEVHLYGADNRPEGHANTAHVTQPGKEPVEVDTYADISIT